MQIDDVNKGIDDSIRELHNIETEIVASRSKDSVDRCVEKLNSCDFNKTKWDNISKDLTKLDQKLEEVLQTDNCYVEPYKEYINNKNNLLSRDIENLNRRVTYFDDERGRILSIAESRRSTLSMEFCARVGIAVSIVASFSAIIVAIITNVQSKKSSENQTKKLEDINSNLSEINNHLKKLLKPEDKRKSK